MDGVHWMRETLMRFEMQRHTPGHLGDQLLHAAVHAYPIHGKRYLEEYLEMVGTESKGANAARSR